MELLKYILRVLSDGLIQQIGCLIFYKKIICSESPYNYKKMWNRLKIFLFSASILLFLKFLKLQCSLGFVKQQNKQQHFALICVMALFLVATAVVLTKSKENRK